jgi:8-oxo-(d)GTP phosphatase
VAQAAALVPVLSGYGPRRILSSPFVRCTETVRPTADALSLRVETVEELAEGNTERAVRLVHRMADEAAVLCTHGDIAAGLLEALVAEGVAGPDEPRLQKGEAWVIVSDGSSLAVSEHLRLPGRSRH